VTSPDGRYAAYIRDFNLWVRDLTADEDRPAADDGRRRGLRLRHEQRRLDPQPRAAAGVVARLAADQATFQQDARGIGSMYLVTTNVGTPQLQQWRYPLPQDTSRSASTVSSSTWSLRASCAADAAGPAALDDLRPHRHRHRCSTWSGIPTGRTSRSCRRRVTARRYRSASRTRRPARCARYSRRRRPRSSSPAGWPSAARTGACCRRERGAVVVAARQLGAPLPVRPAHRRAEAAGHDGRLERGRGDARRRSRPPCTSRASAARRAATRTSSTCTASNLDGRGLTLLTPEDANHAITLSPDRRHFVDTYSTTTTPPVTVLRRMDGR
jgi:dipeptidyl-peptidase 4